MAHLLKDRQAARGSVAPLGAKGWLRVSMCQIASASLRLELPEKILKAGRVPLDIARSRPQA